MKCGTVFIIALFLLVTESTSNKTALDAIISDLEMRAREWIKYADTFLSDLYRIKQTGEWNYETNMTEETERQRDESYEKFVIGYKVINLKLSKINRNKISNDKIVPPSAIGHGTETILYSLVVQRQEPSTSIELLFGEWNIRLKSQQGFRVPKYRFENEIYD